MKNPPYEAQQILQVLHRHIKSGTIHPDIPATLLSYSDVLDELHWTRKHLEPLVKALERQGLGKLTIWTSDEQHPAVTGLIIDRKTGKPDPGYFRLFERSGDDKQWWLVQIEASLHYPWQRYLSALDPVPPPPTPQARDMAETERVPTATYRVLRDSELARRVKELHQYRCQMCDQRIELRAGEGYYAETHHIQPLGEPHNGPDVVGNIICVCPNCHARLDFGVIPLEASQLPRVAHHIIEQRFIDYHNRNIYAADAEAG